MYFKSSQVVFAGVLLLMSPLPAAAGGTEYAGAGPRALARAGAVAAKPEDAMVLLYNPAGLAELRGTQLMAAINIPLLSACVEPIGYYGWGHNNVNSPAELIGESGAATMIGAADASYFDDPLDRVCLDERITPVPQLGLTFRVSDELGFGLGLIYPAYMPTGRWGDDKGLIRGDTGELRPSPVRYMQMKSAAMGYFPTLGFGWKVADWLRIGASFQWGILRAKTVTMTRIVAGTHPAADQPYYVKADDYFIPGGIFSVHAVPIEAIDIVASARMQGDFDASGSGTLTSGVFDPTLDTHQTHIDLARVHQQLPWSFSLGLRYADRLRPRATGHGENDTDPDNLDIRDPLSDERWDLELDLVYEINSRVDRQSVTGVNTCQPDPADPSKMVGCQETFQKPMGAMPMPVSIYPVDPQYVEKYWRNQLSTRLGGSYNILPGVFSLSAGVHYENRGVTPEQMQVDYWPLQRVGLHTGFTVRFRQIDLSFAYAHIFQETLTLSAPATQMSPTVQFNRTTAPEACTLKQPACVEVAERNPPARADAVAGHPQRLTNFAQGGPFIVNAGTYNSDLDVLAVGLTLHH